MAGFVVTLEDLATQQVFAFGRSRERGLTTRLRVYCPGYRVGIESGIELIYVSMKQIPTIAIT